MIRTKRAQAQKTIEEINITPFTDVCLVLLIIFMVTMPKITLERSMKLNLPKAANQQELVPKAVTVQITRDRKLYVDGDIVAWTDLEAKLAAMHQKDGTRRLVVRGDEAIPYQYVVTTIDTARKVGVDQVNLATRHEQ